MAGVKLAMLRETDLPPWASLELAEKLAADVHAHDGWLLVSERADLAKLADADGVLITSSSHPAIRTKALLGRGGVIGFVARDEQDLEATSLDAADFVLVQDVFPGDDLNAAVSPGDLARLRHAAGACKVPVIATGGITPQRAPLALEAGAHGVAMCEAAMESPNVALLVEAFRHVLGRID